jgi:hypothetical protein
MVRWTVWSLTKAMTTRALVYPVELSIEHTTSSQKKIEHTTSLETPLAAVNQQPISPARSVVDSPPRARMTRDVLLLPRDRGASTTPMSPRTPTLHAGASRQPSSPGAFPKKERLQEDGRRHRQAVLQLQLLARPIYNARPVRRSRPSAAAPSPPITSAAAAAVPARPDH